MVIILISTNCVDYNRENCHNSITIVNNSDNDIYYYPNSNYPDTSIVDPNPANSGNEFRIEKYSYKNDTHNSCIEGKYLIVNKYIYFIYNAQTIDAMPWDTVKKKYLILKRYDLTLQDLQQMNWTITYP